LIGAAAVFLACDLLLDEIDDQAVLVAQELHHLGRRLRHLDGGRLRDAIELEMRQQQPAQDARQARRQRIFYDLVDQPLQQELKAHRPFSLPVCIFQTAG